jgi:hypothetical protein
VCRWHLAWRKCFHNDNLCRHILSWATFGGRVRHQVLTSAASGDC